MLCVLYVFIFNGNDDQINNRPLANLLDLSSYKIDCLWAWHGSRPPAIVPTYLHDSTINIKGTKKHCLHLGDCIYTNKT